MLKRILYLFLSSLIVLSNFIIANAVDDYKYSLDGGFFYTTNLGYSITNNGASKYQTAIQNAVGMWNNSTNVLSLSESSNPQVQFVVDYYGDRDWAAQASVVPGWGQTYQTGLIEISTYDLDDNSEGTIRVIVAHEIGHIYGLNHVDYNDVLMYSGGAHVAVRNNSSLYSAPSASDLRGVAEAYNLYA